MYRLVEAAVNHHAANVTRKPRSHPSTGLRWVIYASDVFLHQGFESVGRGMEGRKQLGVVVAVASLLIVEMLTMTSAFGAPTPYQAIFKLPEGMVLNDGHLWEADSSANEVVELNSSNGSLIRFVNASADRFNSPSDIASSGRYLWVTSSDCVTQLNASNGSLVRVLKAAKYHFDFPGSITFGDSHIWMVNGGTARSDASIVELDPTNGSLVRVIKSWSLVDPYAITINGPDVWVTDQQASTVEEFSAEGGSLIRVLTAVEFSSTDFTKTNYHFDQPSGIASYGSDVWVSDSGNFPMTEINGSTGALVRVVKSTSAWLRNANVASGGDSAWGIAVTQAHVWIANGGNVVELNASNGQLMRVVGDTADHIDGTEHVVADGQYVWASTDVGTIVQLNANNGRLVRLIQSRRNVTVHGPS